MPITRKQKEERLDVLRNQFRRAQAVIIADYQGMTVEQVTALRRDMRKQKVDYLVSKNTLARLATADTPFAKLNEYLKGMNSIGIAYDDPIPLAKVLQEYTKSERPLKVRVGMLGQDGRILTPNQIKMLAELPSRDVLLAQLFSVLGAQPRQLVYTLKDLIGKFLRTLTAIQLKRT